MDFNFTTEQKMITDAAQRMVERDILPILDAGDKSEVLSKPDILKIFAAAAELGLTSARIPESGGGAGLSMLDYGLITQNIPPTIGLMLQPHEATATRIFYGGSDEQRETYLESLIAGTMIAATGNSEPNMGSNPREVKTRIREDGDELILNGTKMWISNATTCDLANITGKIERADGTTSVARVLVDMHAADVQTRPIHMMGLCQSPHGEMVFSDCRVPKSSMSPDKGDTAKLLTLTWLSNRPLVGLMAVNQASRAFNIALEHSKSRKQFGKYIGEFQLIQQDLSEADALITSARLMCLNALSVIDSGGRANGVSAMAKRYAVDACDKAIALAMRICGAMGLSNELGLEQMARDVRMLTIPDGTPGILTLIHGRELTGLSAIR